MTTKFNPEWKAWIKTNIESGQNKSGLFKILLDEGFTYQTIRDEMQFEPQSKSEFSVDWKSWIKTNVDDGHDRNGLFKILLDEGFTYKAIYQEMQFEPSLPTEQLVNPLKPKDQEQATNPLPAVDLNQLFIPNGQKLGSNALPLFTVDNFLDSLECKALVTEIKQNLSAEILNEIVSGQDFHQGGVCELGLSNNPLTKEIDQRLCKLIGIDPSYSEPLQGQYFGADQSLRSYTDYLEQHEMDHHDALMGHRTFTVMIYLNNVESGGGTHFPAANTTIKPKTGFAVIWSNLGSDGAPRTQSARNSMPVIKGYQAVITKWFRSKSRLPDTPPMFIRDVNELIPAYTEAGFAKAKLPEILFSKVQDFYQSNRSAIKEETVAGDFIVNTAKSDAKGSSLIDLSTELRAEIHDNLKTLLEAWCGKALMPTYVYGIRIYHRSATLKCHRDRLATHIIGAIINIDQDVEEDWILVIDDHQHRRHQIALKPGEMIFYESGSLIHGRPTPFKGDLFANVFCHFKPVDYVPRAITQDT